MSSGLIDEKCVLGKNEFNCHFVRGNVQTCTECLKKNIKHVPRQEDLNDYIKCNQDKYKFKNNYQLEAYDVYDFCNDIRQAYYLGLCIDEEDLEFIETVLDKISS